MNKMVVVNIDRYKFYLDGYLKSNIDLLIKAVKKDRDCLIIIDGKEREGKSTIANQLAKYCDPTYDVDRCCLTPEEFLDKVKDAKQYQAVVLDEGQGFTSRSALSRLNKVLIRVLSEIGMKNLFLFICIPSFFELDRYAAIHRSQCLIHIYTKELKRGRFAFWNYKRKKTLYLMGKKYYSYKFPKPNFVARFTKAFPLDKEKYDEKKRMAISRSANTDISYNVNRLISQRNELIRWLLEFEVKQKEIAERVTKNTEYPISESNIGKISRKFGENTPPPPTNNNT